MPAVSPYSLTGNSSIDGLLGDVKWATPNLTFSFPSLPSSYSSSYGSGEASNGFGAFNAAQQSVARSALNLYASVSLLTFTEIAGTDAQHADLRFAQSDEPSTAWAYFPTTDEAGGDVWVNNSSRDYVSPQQGNYAYLTIVHEIGHALGLEHPHEGSAVMSLSRDSLEYTVMSYRSYVGASLGSGYVNETWGYAQSLMIYDIAALQYLYGANFATNSGNTNYRWSPATGEMSVNGVGQGASGANRIFQTVWDGGGVDTYDFSQYSARVKVDLKPGAWSLTSSAQRAKLSWDGAKLAAGNIANALLYGNDKRSLIEKAIGGSGSDVIRGNDIANTLKGNAGNDLLYGRGGNDILLGGSGKDKLYGQSGRDVLRGGTGADTFVFSALKDSTTSNRDTIKDFKRGADHIHLRSIDANTTIKGNQAFAFIGKDAFTGHAGELRFAKGVLYADVNGDTKADFSVKVSGLSALSQGDFYL